jgi:hypothetical protein
MNNETNDPYPWEIVRPIILDIGLFIIMLAFTIASFYASVYTWKHDTEWFQRSGAIMVLIAAIIEYRHLNEYKVHYQQAAMSGGISRGWHLSILIKSRTVIGRLAIYCLVIGTVVWGYGDMPFK